MITHPVPAGSPPGFREGYPHHAQFSHLLEDVVGILPRLVHFFGLGTDNLLGKIPGHVPDHSLFIGQVKVHHSPLLTLDFETWGHFNP